MIRRAEGALTMVGWDTYLDRLGPQGLRLVLAGLLDPAATAALGDAEAGDLPPVERANAVADRVAEDPALAPQLLERLDELAGSDSPGPEDWDEKQLRDAVAAMLRAPDGNSARVLHRLARLARPPLPAAEIRAAAELIAPAVLGQDPGSRPKWVAKVASERAGLRELEQERRELEGRVRQLETQLARALEHAASLEERLSQRLVEVRDLRVGEKSQRDDRQRLERDIARLEKRIGDLNERRAQERTGEITTALRRLTTEQRRTGANLQKLRQNDKDRRDTLAELARRVSSLGQLIERVVDIHEVESRAAAAAQEAILRELSGIRAALGSGEAPEPAPVAARARRGDTPRVGMFVDVQNMFYGAREKNARLDFEALLAAASHDRQLVRAVAYLVEAREIDQSAFIHLLQAKAYEVKRKPLRIRADRTMKGNWDLEMALDALSTAEHLDVVVLVTGDGDFVPLVRQLKLKGCRVEVFGFPRSTAPDLREAADKFVPITRRLLRPLTPERRPRSAATETGPQAEETPAAGEAPVPVVHS